MVRVDSNQLQWRVLGDSTLVLQTGQEVSVHTDRRLNAVASELRQRIMKQLEDGGGYDNPAHRQALSELVVKAPLCLGIVAGMVRSEAPARSSLLGLAPGVAVTQTPDGRVRLVAELDIGGGLAEPHDQRAKHRVGPVDVVGLQGVGRPA
jgi:hypothetical protein